MEQFMLNLFQCEQLMDRPTTNNGTTIDLIFSNCPGQIGTEENYWSDHKMLYFFTQLGNCVRCFVHYYISERNKTGSTTHARFLTTGQRFSKLTLLLLDHLILK